MFLQSFQTTELPAPYGDCNDAVNYTKAACISKCMADYVISECRCKDIYMPGRFQLYVRF